MNTSEILQSQRNLTLSKYGFSIKVENGEFPNYKYTIKNEKFTTTVYRYTKDELDTILQIIFYMDKEPYRISYAEANAYGDCFNALCKSYSDFKTFEYIKEKFITAKKFDADKELEKYGIRSVSSIHCDNILGLEASRKTLPQLYTELKWLAKCAEQHNVTYEDAIKIEGETPQENA